LTLAFLLVSNHCKARKIRADLPTASVDCFVDKWRTTLSDRAGSGFAVSAQILSSNDGNAAYESEVSSKKPAINSFKRGLDVDDLCEILVEAIASIPSFAYRPSP
jgi:hypothetical protein